MIHEYKLRVELEDIDLGGVVFNANYLKYAERARSAMFFEHGFAFAELFDQGYTVVVSDAHCKFRQAAKLYDELFIYTYVKEVVSRKVKMEQIFCLEQQNSEIFAKMTKPSRLCFRTNIELICTDTQNMRACKFPTTLRHFLEANIQ